MQVKEIEIVTEKFKVYEFWLKENENKFLAGPTTPTYSTNIGYIGIVLLAVAVRHNA